MCIKIELLKIISQSLVSIITNPFSFDLDYYSQLYEKNVSTICDNHESYYIATSQEEIDNHHYTIRVLEDC